jgi:hypothetical protein
LAGCDENAQARTFADIAAGKKIEDEKENAEEQ